MAHSGQFKPGNNAGGGKKGKSGRKSKAEELGLKALLDECWCEADRKACIEGLAKDAKSMDFKIRNEARKLLLAYAFGKPTERTEAMIFDYSNEDLDLLNDYELERLIAGDDPRSIFAAARTRLIKEKAKAG